MEAMSYVEVAVRSIDSLHLKRRLRSKFKLLETIVFSLPFFPTTEDRNLQPNEKAAQHEQLADVRIRVFAC